MSTPMTPTVAAAAHAPAAPPRPWRVRPDAAAAAAVYLHAGDWVADAMRSGLRHIVLDLGQAQELDFTSFATALARLRAAGREVSIVNIAPHLAVSLRQLGLVHGARIEEPARRRRTVPTGPTVPAAAAQHTLAA